VTRGCGDSKRRHFISIIDPLLGQTETRPRDRSNRLLDAQHSDHSTRGLPGKFCMRANSNAHFTIPITISHTIRAATPKRTALWHAPNIEVRYVQASASSSRKALAKSAGVATTTVRSMDTQTNVRRRPRDQVVKRLGGGPRSISGCSLQWRIPSSPIHGRRSFARSDATFSHVGEPACSPAMARTDC
jgi:hypothetical protein